MDRKTLSGMLAGAALAAAAFAISGYPPVGGGSEGTVAAAARHRGRELQRGQVTLGDTSAQTFLQSETFARLMQDENVRALLSDERFRAGVSQARLSDALADPRIVQALTNPVAVKALGSPALRSALKDPGFRAALQDARFAEAMGKSDCEEWGCGGNSPAIEAAVICTAGVAARPARRYQSRSAIAANPSTSADGKVRATDPSRRSGPERKQGSLDKALREAHFAEQGKIALNSPIVDGAAINEE